MRVGDETDDVSTMPQLGADDAAAATATYALTVTAGPDKGLRLTIDANHPLRALIGHSPACQLRLSDLRSSRRHASVDLTRKGLRVTDLASMNGTMVGPTRIVEALLVGGEDIRIGDTTIHVERGATTDEAPLTPARRFGNVIGASAAMRRIFPLCEKLAASDLPILLEGEIGTGKETLAEALHEASARAKRPFIVFDCTSVAGGIMAELLCGHAINGGDGGDGGHTKGAIEEADGGTLLIDEIGDLDPLVQPRLLRLIERGEIHPVGSARAARVDVRVVATTRRNLDHEVQTGRFREDLLVRLTAGRIELPPLRDRTEDIGVLTRHFWRTLGGEGKPVPPGLVERFTDYSWPGNVSELIAAVARVLAAGDVVLDGGARPASSSPPPSEAPTNIIDAVLESDISLVRGRDRVVAEFERRYVQRILALHQGNVSRAAAASGLARRYFQLLKAKHLKGG